jgi:glutamate racemase
MPPTDAPIGIFDSGLGGLSVLRAIQAQLPHENLLYLADSGFAPYGNKPDDYIQQRSLWIGEWLYSKGAKAFVVACNTATAVAARVLRERYPQLPIVGVEPGLKPALEVTRNGVIGVLATPSTLASERFARLMRQVQDLSPHTRFLTAPGTGWVEYVERGELTGKNILASVQNSLEPLLSPAIPPGADTLVLGCTHYPFLQPVIQACAPEAHIIDTAPAIARQLERRLQNESLLRPQHLGLSTITLITTGPIASLQSFAQKLLPAAKLDCLS